MGLWVSGKCVLFLDRKMPYHDDMALEQRPEGNEKRFRW